MNHICQKCQTINPPHACYCQLCGATFGATDVQGRTVVAPQSKVRPPSIDTKTIISRVHQTFGNKQIPLTPNQMSPSRAIQREHTIFVTDKSGSMSSPYDGKTTKLEAAIRAEVTMVVNKAQIDPDDEVGIVSFDHEAQILLHLCPICSHRRQVIQTMQSITIQGGTDIDKGLKAARDAFNWSCTDVVRRIVLLTDGQGGHPLQTAQGLKSRGVVIDVIGIGATPSGVNEKLLRQVASVIEGEVRYRFITDVASLLEHYTLLANKTATSAG